MLQYLVPLRCKECELRVWTVMMQMAEDQMALKSLQMKEAYDVWQFGKMVFEGMFGTYWPPGMTDASILHKLATPGASLPHESEGLEPASVKDMLRVSSFNSQMHCSVGPAYPSTPLTVSLVFILVAGRCRGFPHPQV
jgi:hypothetical protein